MPFLQVSLCHYPLSELSNPGASGSLFYRSADDEFIMKTVSKKEAEFLQKLLPGYYLVSWSVWSCDPHVVAFRTWHKTKELYYLNSLVFIIIRLVCLSICLCSACMRVCGILLSPVTIVTAEWREEHQGDSHEQPSTIHHWVSREVWPQGNWSCDPSNNLQIITK